MQPFVILYEASLRSDVTIRMYPAWKMPLYLIAGWEATEAPSQEYIV